MHNLKLFLLLGVVAVGFASGLALAHGKGGHAHGKPHQSFDRSVSYRPARFVGRFDARQERQARRIREGRRSGELTRHEARRLRRQQSRIAHLAERYVDDGRLSRRERRELDALQDRASRRIARLKSNDRARFGDRDFGYIAVFGWCGPARAGRPARAGSDQRAGVRGR
jgi:hypothetical protein